MEETVFSNDIEVILRERENQLYFKEDDLKESQTMDEIISYTSSV